MEGGGGWICAAIGIGLVAILALVAAGIFRRERCTVCGVRIKRTSYRVRINGKRHTLCPNCNDSIEKRRSSAAVHKLFGKGS